MKYLKYKHQSIFPLWGRVLIPVPKIKFDSPPNGKNALVLIF